MLEAILAAISGFVLGVIELLGYPGIFLLMLVGNANIPIPSEITMTFSGFLAGIGKFNFWLVVLVGAAGDIAGSLISYFVADRLRSRLEKNHEFQRAENWYRRFGPLSLLFGKMVPFVRAFIAFPAGIFKIKLWKFLLFTGVGAFAWATLLTYLGAALGENWEAIGPYFRKLDYLVAALFIVALIWYIRHRFSHRTVKS